MKRSLYASRPRQSREIVQLNWLANGLAQAGSRIERTYWHSRLQTLVDELIAAGDDESLFSVLTHLGDKKPVAHDAVMDTIESVVESASAIIDGQPHDVLLIACPLLTWSRYAIPAPRLSVKDRHALTEALKNVVLTSYARVALLGMLVAPDQIPDEFSQIAQLRCNLTEALTQNIDPPLHPQAQKETTRFLSDTRYLVGVVAVPKGEAIFRWQEPRAKIPSSQTNDRGVIERRWAKTFLPTVEPLLAGCNISALLPEAFHAACASVDLASRPYSVEACVHFLSEAINLTPENQRAIIAPFHSERLEEFRIALGPRNEDALYHGVIWPLLGAEDENTNTLAEIEQALRHAGVTDILTHDDIFMIEYCVDCGGPLYANAEGELAHLEMPGSVTVESSVLH